MCLYNIYKPNDDGFRITFFNPSKPFTWLVITLIDTADVNADITGADMKFVKKPETKYNDIFDLLR